MTLAEAHYYNDPTKGGTTVGIFYLAVASGTTADFVVTAGSSTNNGMTLSVYAMYNLNSNTPYVTAQDKDATVTLSSNVTANSFGIGITMNISMPAGQSITWTGLTEDYEKINWLANAKGISVGSQSFTATESPRTITAAYSSAGAYQIGVFAAWS